jgi:hypothetical protein
MKFAGQGLSGFPIGIVVWASRFRLETAYQHLPDTKKDPAGRAPMISAFFWSMIPPGKCRL